MIVLEWIDGEKVLREAAEDELPPPVALVPEAVSRFQARAALMDAGLLEAVEAAVAAAEPLARLAWAEVTELRRASPLVGQIAAQVGLDEAGVDELFRAAARIEV